MTDLLKHLDTIEAEIKALRAALTPSVEPAPTYTVTRVVDNKDRPYDPTTTGYARQSPWSYEGDFIHFSRGDEKIISTLDGRTWKAPVSSDYCWHPKLDSYIYGTSGAHFVRSFWDGDDWTILHTAERGHSLRMSYGEGAVSSRGPVTVALEEEDRSIVVWQEGKGVIARYAAERGHDWCSVTHTGRYVLRRVGRELRRYRADGHDDYAILHDDCQHGDCAIDVNGDDWWVQVGWHGAPGLAVRVVDGKKSLLPAWSDGGHISGRAHRAPGIVCYSTKDRIETFDLARLDDTVIAPPRWPMPVERWTNPNATGESYRRWPQAAISPDGTKIAYSSDDGDPNGPIHCYVVERKTNE